MNPNRLLTLQWLEKAKESKPGATFHIPCDNKHRQEGLFKAFQEELRILTQINPSASSQITPQKRFKDSTLWVVLVKSATDPMAGWEKNPEGEIEKVKLEVLELPERIKKQLKEERL